MNLAIDIGNTAVKVALFDGNKSVAHHSVERPDVSALDELAAAYLIERAIVSASGNGAEEVVALLRARGIHTMEFTAETPVPIKNAYHTPETLGADRLAAAVSAAARYAGKNVLSVDFGTAITIDLITADAPFRGGVISPGMRVRFRALHEQTAHLPLCDARAEQMLQGLTTQQAVEQGVMNGIAFEVEGYIARMREQYDDLQAIFAGGDAELFAKRIKNTTFAKYSPVLDGLNRILSYNETYPR